MKYKINSEEHSPAYLQLYRQVRDDIIQERYAYNSKLPSKRLVADELGISTVTVEHAYALLCEEGYLEARERSGYFVVFRSIDGFAAAKSTMPTKTHPVVHHEIESDFSFSILTKTMRRVMSDYGERLMERSPNAGCSELREAIRNYLARSRGIQVELQRIIIGSGSEYLYHLIAVLMGSNRIYAIETPSYKKIEQVYGAFGLTYRKLPLRTDGIESSALWECDADVLHISPYRSFPSGVSASASKRHEYLQWAAINDRYIIEDDFESEFSISKKPEETLFAHTVMDNVIYMNTFSKTVSPSLRVGYMVLPEHLTFVFEEKFGFISCTVPTFEQMVLTELIENGDFERHINRVRRKKRKELYNSKIL